MVDFTRHKLPLETLGEYLRAARQEQGLSLIGVTASLGVKPGLLTSLESGDFQSLPEPVYVIGFLRRLAGLYLISGDLLVAQYHREARLLLSLSKISPTGVWDRMRHRVLWLRLWYAVPATVVVVVAALFARQLWSINAWPHLEVLAPKTDSVLSAGNIEFSGQATPGSQVALNGQTVFVGKDGHFAIVASFLPGAHKVRLAASGRLGRTVEKELVLLVAASKDSEFIGPLSLQAVSLSPSTVMSASRRLN